VKRLKTVMVRKLDRVKATLARNIAQKKARQERHHKKSVSRADASANAAAHRALKLKRKKYEGLRVYAKMFVHKKNNAHKRNGPNRKTTAKTRKPQSSKTKKTTAILIWKQKAKQEQRQDANEAVGKADLPINSQGKKFALGNINVQKSDSNASRKTFLKQKHTGAQLSMEKAATARRKADTHLKWLQNFQKKEQLKAERAFTNTFEHIDSKTEDPSQDRILTWHP